MTVSHAHPMLEAIFGGLTPPRRTGIRARTHLPSATYDHLFMLEYDRGAFLVVMRPGCACYDKHYWEQVRVTAEEARAVAQRRRDFAAKLDDREPLKAMLLREAAEIEERVG